jgi:hypothetical protein
MKSHSRILAAADGAGQFGDWGEVDFAELAAVRDEVVTLARRAAAPSDGERDNGEPSDGERDAEADDLHRAVARLVLDRFENPLNGHGSSVGWSPFADVVIGTFGSVCGNAIASAVASELPSEVMDPADFTTYVREIASAARCAAGHPVYSFAAEMADREQLAAFLEAKNLTDLNFVNFLTLLMPGADGEPAAEMASNLWDELGHGKVTGFHRNIRKVLMRNVGLAVPGATFDLKPCLLEEVEHFNAYALNGMIRGFSLRLVGMLFTNEFLAPVQLAPVIQGWRRMGLQDSEMEFLISHYEGDIEHANGWADRVVAPCLVSTPFAQREILIGVHQHIQILSRLYDRLLDGLVSGTVTPTLA